MRSFRSRPAGWRRESYRHYLAAKGVSTKKYFVKYGQNFVMREDTDSDEDWGRTKQTVTGFITGDELTRLNEARKREEELKRREEELKRREEMTDQRYTLKMDKPKDVELPGGPYGTETLESSRLSENLMRERAGYPPLSKKEYSKEYWGGEYFAKKYFSFDPIPPEDVEAVERARLKAFYDYLKEGFSKYKQEKKIKEKIIADEDKVIIEKPVPNYAVRNFVGHDAYGGMLSGEKLDDALRSFDERLRKVIADGDAELFKAELMKNPSYYENAIGRYFEELQQYDKNIAEKEAAEKGYAVRAMREKSMNDVVSTVAAPELSGRTFDAKSLNFYAKKVDLKRYAGTWRQVSVKNEPWFQQGMTAVSATYTVNPDGSVKVVNRGRVNGRERKIEGVARSVSDDNRKLKVSFGFPFPPGDYEIKKINKDYTRATVKGGDTVWELAKVKR